MSYKVVLLGEGRVGKTSIGKRWVTSQFDPMVKQTVTAAFFEKTIEVNGKSINVHLWDTAGQEEYHSITPIYYKGSNAALLVYSVIDRKSIERAAQWKKELVSSQGNDIVTIVVANKIDMVKDRCISEEEGKKFAESINSPYFEVSAKTGDGIQRLFDCLGNSLSKIAIASNKGQGRRPGARSGLRVEEHEEVEDKPSGCC